MRWRRCSRENARQTAAPPDTQQVLAFLSKTATVRAATESVGGSMQRATRETDEAVMYEYRHVNRPATATRDVVVLHQSYLKK
jgi:hypothetical protein